MCDTSASSSNQSVVTDKLMRDLSYNFAQQPPAHGTAIYPTIVVSNCNTVR